MSRPRQWSCTVGTDQRSSRTALGRRGPSQVHPCGFLPPALPPPPKSRVPPGWRRAGSRKRTQAGGPAAPQREGACVSVVSTTAT